MPSTYSTDLRIELIANGEQSGTWGQTTNTNLGTLIEDAIAGSATVSITSANQALTIANGAADQSRNASIVLTTTTTANFAVYIPPVPKLYTITNSSGSYTATIYCSTVAGNTTAAGAGVVIPAGKSVLVRSTGVNVVEQINHVAGNFSTNGALTVDDGATIGASAVVGGDVTALGALYAREPIYANSTAYLNGLAAQTVAQGSAINTSAETITLASAVFVNDTAVMLTSSDTMPTGLSTNTLYYVVNTSATSFFSGTGYINDGAGSGSTTAGTVLTITSLHAGAIGVGTVISGTGVTTTTTVTSLGSGTGGVGTYNVSTSQYAASTTINGTYSGSQTIKLSTSSGGSAVDITAVGTGNLTLTPVALANTPPVGASTTAVATAGFVTSAVTASVVDSRVLASVNAATTQSITLSGTQTIDGVALSVGNRVLVKNQLTGAQAAIFDAATEKITVTTAPSNGTQVMFTTTGALPTGLSATQVYYVVDSASTTFSVSLSPGGAVVAFSGTASGTNTVGTLPAATNGIYTVASSTWTRSTDANTSAELAAAQVAVTAGTVNGGKQFVTTFKSTDTLDTTIQGWNLVATDAVGGVTAVQLASNAVTTVNITDANITAAKLNGAQSGSAPIYGARAFGIVAANGTLTRGFNIATATRIEEGRYSVTFTTAMTSAVYAVVGSSLRDDGVVTFNYYSLSTTGFSITLRGDGGSRIDYPFSLVVFA
jgi:hypothetical protein